MSHETSRQKRQRKAKTPAPYRCRLHIRRNRLFHNRFRRGDLVRFASRIRPNLLPREADKHGIVVSSGLWGVTVRFNEFPEEPVFCGWKELRFASGIRPQQEEETRKQNIKQYQSAKNTNWK